MNACPEIGNGNRFLLRPHTPDSKKAMATFNFQPPLRQLVNRENLDQQHPQAVKQISTLLLTGFVGITTVVAGVVSGSDAVLAHPRVACGRYQSCYRPIVVAPSCGFAVTRCAPSFYGGDYAVRGVTFGNNYNYGANGFYAGDYAIVCNSGNCGQPNTKPATPPASNNSYTKYGAQKW